MEPDELEEKKEVLERKIKLREYQGLAAAINHAINQAQKEDKRFRLPKLISDLCLVVSWALDERYSVDEVKAWVRHTIDQGGHLIYPPAYGNNSHAGSVITPSRIKSLYCLESIPNAPLREAVLSYVRRAGTSYSMVAQEVWPAMVRRESERKLRRVLAMDKADPPNYQPNMFIGYGQAERIGFVIQAIPHEIGV